MGDDTKVESSSPFAAMFEGFRGELDGHHDRRERIVKASRDITAASKKIIFTLQRVRRLGEQLPAFAGKNNAQHWQTIENQYKAVVGDLQGLNAYRYGRNITGGSQEFMEALSFQHYLETQNLISFKDAQAKLDAICGEKGSVLLTPEDYILGLFDMTGELMRFAITAMATSGKLPIGKPKSADQMDVDDPPLNQQQSSRNVLSDLRDLRLQLEMMELPQGTKFTEDAEKKMLVMRQSVEKVESALYGLTVRGTERPKGWVPDVKEDRRMGNGIESY